VAARSLRSLPAVLAGAALLAWAPAASASLVAFRTPSGNIGCIGDATYLRCDIRSTTVPSPPRPRSCDLDYGDAFGMAPRSRARRICHGDTALGAGPVLPYGRARRIGPFRCASQAIGLTCRNRAGHGWFLSREKIRLV
jgi:hypothetical protein